MAWACVGPVDAVPNAAVPTPIAALRLIKLRRLSFFLSSVDPESPALFLDILILPLLDILTGIPQMSFERRELLRFSDLPTRQSWGADSDPHRGRPERRAANVTVFAGIATRSRPESLTTPSSRSCYAVISSGQSREAR